MTGNGEIDYIKSRNSSVCAVPWLSGSSRGRLLPLEYAIKEKKKKKKISVNDRKKKKKKKKKKNSKCWVKKKIGKTHKPKQKKKQKQKKSKPKISQNKKSKWENEKYSRNSRKNANHHCFIAQKRAKTYIKNARNLDLRNHTRQWRMCTWRNCRGRLEKYFNPGL
jgi:hypothetical protein